jgi:hypothetical protein
MCPRWGALASSVFRYIRVRGVQVNLLAQIEKPIDGEAATLDSW